MLLVTEANVGGKSLKKKETMKTKTGSPALCSDLAAEWGPPLQTKGGIT